MDIAGFERVVEIATQAGDIILSLSGDRAKWDLEYKAINDPVTAADKQAHLFISENLQSIEVAGEGDIPVLSEEGVIPDFATRKNWRRYWCVDPLDGTREFVDETGEYTVNIALCEDNVPVAGVIHTPHTGETAWAIRGQGAFLKPQRTATTQEKIVSTAFAWNDKNLIATVSRRHGKGPTQDFMDKLGIVQTKYSGSSIKFVTVARGLAHFYPRFAPTWEWDTCAAQVILEEAGGQILQIDENGQVTRKKLVYNKPDLHNPYFVATGSVTGLP